MMGCSHFLVRATGHTVDAPCLGSWVEVHVVVALVVVSDQIGDPHECLLFAVFCVDVGVVLLAQSSVRGFDCGKQDT